MERPAGREIVLAAHTGVQNETERCLVASTGAGKRNQPAGRKLTLAAAASTQTTGADMQSQERALSRRA